MCCHFYWVYIACVLHPANNIESLELRLPLILLSTFQISCLDESQSVKKLLTDKLLIYKPYVFPQRQSIFSSHAFYFSSVHCMDFSAFCHWVCPLASLKCLRFNVWSICMMKPGCWRPQKCIWQVGQNSKSSMRLFILLQSLVYILNFIKEETVKVPCSVKNLRPVVRHKSSASVIV